MALGGRGSLRKAFPPPGEGVQAKPNLPPPPSAAVSPPSPPTHLRRRRLRSSGAACRGSVEPRGMKAVRLDTLYPFQPL